MAKIYSVIRNVRATICIERDLSPEKRAENALNLGAAKPKAARALDIHNLNATQAEAGPSAAECAF
jgi:hypothetical protein